MNEMLLGRLTRNHRFYIAQHNLLTATIHNFRDPKKISIVKSVRLCFKLLHITHVSFFRLCFYCLHHISYLDLTLRPNTLKKKKKAQTLNMTFSQDHAKIRKSQSDDCALQKSYYTGLGCTSLVQIRVL